MSRDDVHKKFYDRYEEKIDNCRDIEQLREMAHELLASQEQTGKIIRELTELRKAPERVGSALFIDTLLNLLAERA